ncbi:MAG TPA: hypothetical protein VFU21_27170, partial [Kofleriaceae bacterium]|nr:hypothetical protein [Kofleriaceae bacterium]
MRCRAPTALLVLAAACCREPEPNDTVSPELGDVLAAGAAHAIAASGSVREPYRCADAPPPTAQKVVVGRRTLTVAGDTLTVTPADHALVLGVVSDARGATAETAANLATVREAFDREKVDLVVSLGGMGTSDKELAAVYDALGAPLWAIPGDRESIPAHRAALATLASEGRAVFDGSRVKAVATGGVLIAALAGADSAGQLMAGADGCLYAPADVTAVAARLATHAGVRVWAGHAAPRQRGPGSADVALGGVHVGNLALAAALPAARAHLVLHGQVDQAGLAPPAGRGRAIENGPPVVLGTGPVEAMPVVLVSDRAALEVVAKGGGAFGDLV